MAGKQLSPENAGKIERFVAPLWMVAKPWMPGVIDGAEGLQAELERLIRDPVGSVIRLVEVACLIEEARQAGLRENRATEAQERLQRHAGGTEQVYGPGSSHSYFADFARYLGVATPNEVRKAHGVAKRSV